MRAQPLRSGKKYRLHYESVVLSCLISCISNCNKTQGSRQQPLSIKYTLEVNIYAAIVKTRLSTANRNKNLLVKLLVEDRKKYVTPKTTHLFYYLLLQRTMIIKLKAALRFSLKQPDQK